MQLSKFRFTMKCHSFFYLTILTYNQIIFRISLFLDELSTEQLAIDSHFECEHNNQSLMCKEYTLDLTGFGISPTYKISMYNVQLERSIGHLYGSISYIRH